MHGYWEQLQRLVAGGEPFVSVTLVDVVASAPANVGSKMLVTAAGLYHGTVGGGKIEAKAIAAAVAMLSHDGGRPGGGEATGWKGRRHEGEGGGARFVEWNLQTDVGMTCGGVVRLFFERYNVAAWPVVIFGAGHCAQALVRLLLTLRCQVTVIDPRPEWLAKLPAAKRALVRAVKIEGHSIADAAAATGMSETSVKVTLHRALRSLGAGLGGGHADG